MDRVRGCFWLCGGCLEGDVFKSEAKFELVIKKHEVLYDVMNEMENLFEQHSAFWGLTGRRQHALRTSILSPGSMCQSVIFGSLTLRNTNKVILG